MNRHERRSIDAQHDKFVSALTSPQEKIASKARDKFMKDLKARGGTVDTMFGAFGPESGWADAYIEEVVKPATGGTFVKLYGCPYLMKGIYGKNVEALQFSKAIFSAIPREIVNMPFVAIGLVFTWFLHRKGFIKFIKFVIDEINHKVVRHYEVPEKEYNLMPQAVYRAMVASEVPPHFARLVRLFLETDNTYRLRIQDALPLAPDLLTFLSILQDRETKDGVGHKWAFLRVIVRIARWTSPALRMKEVQFFRNLNRYEVKMDEHDWYFALDFKSYNFGGIGYDERHSLRRQANEEKGVAFLI